MQGHDAHWTRRPARSVAQLGRLGRLEHLVLALFQLGFFVALGRLEYALLVLAAARTEALELARSPALLELSMLAPLVLLAPAVLVASRLLRRWSLQPALAGRFALAFVLFALACFCLGLGIEWSLAQGFVGLGAIVASAAVLSLAALCIGPAAISAVTSVEGRLGCAGLWLIGYASGRALGASVTGLDALFDACVAQGLAAVAVAVVLVFSWRPLSPRTSEGPGPRTLAELGARGLGSEAWSRGAKISQAS